MTDREQKLTSGLLGTLNKTPNQVPVSVIVRYSNGMRAMRHPTPLPGVRRSYRYRLQPFEHLHATSEAIDRLAADPDVVKIYQDLPVHAYLDAAVPHVEAPRLWDDGFKGEGVRIAIVDTGIDPTHPDFEGRIAEMTDFTGEGTVDQHGHGTHCASIAAGSGAASSGLYRGAAPAATLYTAKVLRSDGQGMMSDVMAGVEWAVDQGVQIVSLSLGGSGPCDGSDALSEMCDAAVQAGLVVCVAAGNDGPAAYTVGSPGCAREVITVGAASDLDRIASFSSRGPTLDGRTKPDVVAPGVEIVAARAAGTAMGTVVNDYYTTASGTSMATPLVAGVCALLLQALPSLTPAEVKARLMNNAVDLGEAANTQGSGRIDAWAAFENATTEPTPTPEPTPEPTPGGCMEIAARLLALISTRRR